MQQPAKRVGVMFATQSGGTTLDSDADGGNPFATALIRVLTDSEPVLLTELPDRVRAVTLAVSRGHQEPEWRNWPRRQKWAFALTPGSRQESRHALVLVVSQYDRAPLLGAARDERRIAALFSANGFSVTQGVCSTRDAILAAVSEFARVSTRHDVSVVYATGHGREQDGTVYLIPADYPFQHGFSRRQLQSSAVSIEKLAMACRGSSLRMVFFAGCRASS
jgi:hypothetical protein